MHIPLTTLLDLCENISPEILRQYPNARWPSKSHSLGTRIHYMVFCSVEVKKVAYSSYKQISYNVCGWLNIHDSENLNVRTYFSGLTMMPVCAKVVELLLFRPATHSEVRKSSSIRQGIQNQICKHHNRVSFERIAGSSHQYQYV